MHERARMSGRGETWARVCALILAAAPLAGGCSTDIFDITVNLSSETYSADFGQQSGTIPTVTCDPTTAGTCGSEVVGGNSSTATTGPAQVSVSVGCDASSDRCFAQVNARVVYPVDVLQDDNFVTKVAQRTIALVRLADLAYTVPANTLTFEAPAVAIYVGPPGTALETDPGVVSVGMTAQIPAGTVVTTPQHITISDGSPARALIEQSVMAEQPFVFVLTLAPRVEAGQPIPGGAFQVDLFPQVQLGF